MTKKGGGHHGGGRRRKNSKDISDDEEESSEDKNDIVSCSPTDTKGMSFADRRDFQRKAAADKRRQKMKCHLCGKAGHTRKQCPGIEDGGRGASKYTKSNGDAGATILKNKGRKKNHERGQKQRSKSEDDNGYDEDLTLLLPPGFEKKKEEEGDDTPSTSALVPLPPFKYFDAGFDEGTAVLEYLRFGRGVKVKHSRKEAIEEYENTMKKVCDTTNFGGCITRCYLPNSADNKEEDNDEYTFDDTSSSDVVENNKDAIEYLVSTVEDDNKNKNIVGVFADLDYTYMTTSISKKKNKNKNNKVHNHDRDTQLRKLRCTVKAAIEIGCAIQIRILPSSSSSSSSISVSSNNGNGEDGDDGEDENGDDIKDPYLLAIQDLAALLSETTTSTTNEIHLSSWNGKSEHMMVLLKAFPNNLYIGFDSTITFQKATHIHECAFDLPLNKLVLETCSPSLIPSCIANSIDTRYAFCHSGYIPIIANEIAKYSSKNISNLNFNNCLNQDIRTIPDTNTNTNTNAVVDEDAAAAAAAVGGGTSKLTGTTTTTTLTAEMVARFASTNTISLYGIS
ncbi:hypothetical protein FRACYDRAFT_238452 [Fragilariopsis cylindrus CCMP1102]|uniref:CCHC-type domain-containing protein n=1 Tax=Fragilariopsis cylindrus CCMP1102 TaxID=635003 RepID=A0A1E7FIM3_9STRA|nr:hypothetical protein FRACYDRAFT_238452 [Fragilariopsis cylindrus CCMP1102]|eukprot:OEU18020.1 hypothetical protein FRACYDRAFT_238452 [Fragilariopsis cylindrus CCMP1102]